MESIESKVNKARQEQEDNIRKSLVPTWEDIKNEIVKSKRAQVGEVHEWGGIKMRKETNGWVPVKEGGEKSNGEQGEKQSVSLEEHAKNASEQALINATKMSNNPKIREAAHKELMRRKNEEAQETFKAPEDQEDNPDIKGMMNRGLHAADSKKKEPESGENKGKEEKEQTENKEDKDMDPLDKLREEYKDKSFKDVVKVASKARKELDKFERDFEKRNPGKTAENSSEEFWEMRFKYEQLMTLMFEKEEEEKELEGIDKELINKFKSLSEDRQSEVISSMINEVQSDMSKDAVSEVIEGVLSGLSKEDRKKVLERAIGE